MELWSCPHFGVVKTKCLKKKKKQQQDRIFGDGDGMGWDDDGMDGDGRAALSGRAPRVWAQPVLCLVPSQSLHARGLRAAARARARNEDAATERPSIFAGGQTGRRARTQIRHPDTSLPTQIRIWVFPRHGPLERERGSETHTALTATSRKNPKAKKKKKKNSRKL